MLWGLVAVAALGQHEPALALAAADRALPGLPAEDQPAVAEAAAVAARCIGRWDRFLALTVQHPGLLSGSKKETATLAALAKTLPDWQRRQLDGPDPWQRLAQAPVGAPDLMAALLTEADAVASSATRAEFLLPEPIFAAIAPDGANVALEFTALPGDLANPDPDRRTPVLSCGFQDGGINGKIVAQVQVCENGLVSLRVADLPRWHIPGTWPARRGAIKLRLALVGDRCCIWVDGTPVADAPIALAEAKRHLTAFVFAHQSGAFSDWRWIRLGRPGTQVSPPREDPQPDRPAVPNTGGLAGDGMEIF